MPRRTSCRNEKTIVSLACPSLLPSAVAGEYKKVVFKIKTKGRSVVGNVVIEAKDMEAATYKLRKRYPDCEIM